VCDDGKTAYFIDILRFLVFLTRINREGAQRGSRRNQKNNDGCAGG
jgi:hypothetical protein